MSAEPPDHNPTGQGLNNAVEAETDQGNGTGRITKPDGRDRFGDIVSDREILKVEGFFEEVSHTLSFCPGYDRSCVLP
jgi:hypothetical protein